MTQTVRKLHPDGDGSAYYSAPGDVPASTWLTRMETIDEELLLAEVTLAELVHHLEPVLPIGFGQDTRRPPHDDDVPGLSPLASRLAGLSHRAHDVVVQLRTIAAAVDL